MLAQVENPGVFLCRFVPASPGPLLGVCTRVEYDRVGLCTSVLRETIRMVFSFRSLFGTLSGRGGVAPVHVSLPGGAEPVRHSCSGIARARAGACSALGQVRWSIGT